MGEVFLSEVIGTGVLVLLGCGVVATAILPKSKGFGGGWLLINIGWGLAVMAGVYASFKSGAHINPAVTLGLLLDNDVTDFAPGVSATFGHALLYMLAQLIGAMIGAFLTWVAFKKHFDEEADAGTKLGVFSTGPAIRSLGWNTATEVIGTFILVFIILSFGSTPAELGPLPVAFLVIGIGASLGGPTGYAINPARDLGPRIVHALLPIPGKGSSDWSYSWVPVVGPLIGGALAAVVANAYL